MPTDEHLDGCPALYRFPAETPPPDPDHCPYCAWGRIYGPRRSTFVVELVVIVLILLVVVVVLGMG